ncbi:MAG: TonB-dependent receptor [Halieaceae bacterium]
MRTLVRSFDYRGFAALVLFLVPSGGATAQSEPDYEIPDSRIEEVIVLGSRITRRDYASPSPVYTVSRESLELQGLPNLESVLNRLPQFSPSYGKVGVFGDAGQATINLRGLGANRNLVLLDGERLGPSGMDGVIDLNTLPPAMMERIEVLTGGASAVYGSDAMSGVVNFVTRRDFEGLELSGNYDTSAEGDAEVWSINVAGGRQFANGRGNVSGFLDYYHQDPLRSNERGFSEYPLTEDDDGQLQFFGSTNTPSGFISNTAFIDGDYNWVTFNDDGTPRAFVYPGDGYNYHEFTYLQTELERFSGRIAIDYSVTDELHASIELLGSHSEDEQQHAPAWPYSSDSFQVNLDNPLLTDETRQLFSDNYEYLEDGMAYIDLRRRLEESGPRVVSGERENWRAGFRLDGTLSADWTWGLAYHYSDHSVDWSQSPGLSLSRFQQGLLVDPQTGECFDPDNGCVPVDPFGRGRISPEAIEFLSVYQPDEKYEVNMHQASLFTEGDVDIGLPEAVGLAMGLEWRREEGSYDPDPSLFTGDVLGYPASDAVDGDYDMTELFVEVYLPLLRDQFFARELSLEAGLRYSDHSVIGDVQTWKSGLSWSPVESLRLRAMFQHAVRAPNLKELYTVSVEDMFEAGGFDLYVNDPCQAEDDPVGNGYTDLCVAQGIPADEVGTWEADPFYLRTFTDGGNQDLDPEEADTWTVGFVWQPESVEGLSLALDWYQIEIEDAIQYMKGDTAIYTCFQIGAQDSEFCNSFSRAADGNIERQTGTYRNLAKINAEGLDLHTEYGFDAPGRMPGRLTVSLLANWNLDTSFQADKLSPKYQCEGLFGWPCDLTSFGSFPEFRTVTRLSYGVGRFNTELVWHWIDEMEHAEIPHWDILFPGDDWDPNQLETAKITSNNYFDLHAAWQITEQLRIITGVNNLTDNDPPMYGYQQRGNNTDPSMFDVIGRRYHLSVNWRL